MQQTIFKGSPANSRVRIDMPYELAILQGAMKCNCFRPTQIKLDLQREGRVAWQADSSSIEKTWKKGRMIAMVTSKMSISLESCCAISGSKALKNPLSSWTFSTYPWVLSESSGNMALNTRCASLRCLRRNCSVTVSQHSIKKNWLCLCQS